MNFTFLKLTVASIVATFIVLATALRSPTSPSFITILYDQTDTTLIRKVDQIAGTFAKLVDIDTINGKWGSVTVNLSIIGNSSTQEILTVYLAPSNPYWLRNEMEHRERGRKFFSDLKAALVKITAPGFGTDKSYINRVTHYHLSDLAERTGNRYCIIYSDLIEYGPVVRLYDFRDAPHMISEKQDELIDMLNRDRPLPDLSGIRIINIHKSKPGDDELHERAKQLFKIYWESKGALVDLLSGDTQI